MYQPPHFQERRPEVLQALIRAHPLATLVCLVDGGLAANHVPMLIDPTRGPRGTLLAHVARGNELVGLAPRSKVLAIFQGEESYVTPAWYETKRQTGKVVPTWNYVVVHAHGELTVRDDAAWVRGQIEALTEAQEKRRPEPWAVSDAPGAFIAAQMKGIVGLEIAIDRLEGKWKVSQNRSAEDRKGVSAGLRRQGDGEAMARLVDDFGPP